MTRFLIGKYRASRREPMQNTCGKARKPENIENTSWSEQKSDHTSGERQKEKENEKQGYKCPLTQER